MKSPLHYWKRALTQKQPLRFALSRVLWRSGLCRYLVIDRGSYRLRFFPSALSADLWVSGNERKGDEAFFTAYLRPGDTVVDVGANVGALSLTAAGRVGNLGKVFAIEPHPKVFKFLTANIALNRRNNITAMNLALSNQPGELCFSDLDCDDCNGVVSDSSLKVTTLTLDTLLNQGVEHVALLKVDVEGFEKFVFEGGHAMLERTDCVYFEVWDAHFAKYDYTTDDVLDLLRRHGLMVLRFLAKESVTLVPANYSAPRCENLLAVCDAGQFCARTGFTYINPSIS